MARGLYNRLPHGATATGKARKAPPSGGLWPHEIEPGRAVPNHWDSALFETWSARKARLAREAAGHG